MDRARDHAEDVDDRQPEQQQPKTGHGLLALPVQAVEGGLIGERHSTDRLEGGVAHAGAQSHQHDGEPEAHHDDAELGCQPPADRRLGPHRVPGVQPRGRAGRQPAAEQAGQAQQAEPEHGQLRARVEHHVQHFHLIESGRSEAD